ncbi:hypothetical protein R3P38DRAFT_2800995 [Favolaschia claudopus]|uniref:DUF6589 domain-containing protein n=1 Tax=Favolaschia claudopus TaxID=2862362 RepID=A0AAV9ZWZ9_9AGAR
MSLNCRSRSIGINFRQNASWSPVSQTLLGTLPIPEASYEDNSRLILEWLKQLVYDTPDAQKKLGLEQVMAWVGDQLTVDRLQNLYRFRAEDDNSFERLDWLLIPPGWLHIQMAFANSLHKQHLGTRGLSAAFDTYLEAERTSAQIRELWLQVGKADTLANLRSKSPQELFKLAEQILTDHASSAALVKMQIKPRPDEIKTQSIMFLRDVMPYILLRSAVKHGDVGLMEDMIPLMLFRSIGGKNNNYTGEMLEMLQGLQREWPPEIREFVRDNCWVINNTTTRVALGPLRSRQRAVSVTYRSEGPNIDWDYLKKLHPAIHVIRAVNSHMESEFKTRIRGRRYTVPKKEQDIRELQQWYRASDVHKFKPGRKISNTGKSKDKPVDVPGKGGIAIQTGKTLQRWVEIRSVERAINEDWDDFMICEVFTEGLSIKEAGLVRNKDKLEQAKRRVKSGAVEAAFAPHRDRDRRSQALEWKEQAHPKGGREMGGLPRRFGCEALSLSFQGLLPTGLLFGFLCLLSLLEDGVINTGEDTEHILSVFIEERP